MLKRGRKTGNAKQITTIKFKWYMQSIRAWFILPKLISAELSYSIQ